MTAATVERAARQPWRPPRLPAAPLLRLVMAAGGPAAIGATAGQGRGAEERALNRAAAQGWITAYAGDRLAIELLGLHPAQVWGDEWWVNVG